MLEKRRLDQRWEPLAGVPVASQVLTYLAKTNRDGAELRLLCRKVKNAFRDPLRLSIS